VAKDLQILPDAQGEIAFSLLGASEDTGLMLLQRLYMLMLSDMDEGYRTGAQGYSLLAFLEGGNMPEDGVLDAMLSITCALALKALDPEDRERVSSFTAKALDGGIHCTLKLADGTTVGGELKNG